MDEKIRGSFPGGPRKSQPAAERTGAPRLSRVQDIERRSADRQQGRARGRRKKRFFFGLVVSLVAAGSVGLYFGQRSHTTLEELRAEQEAALGPGSGSVDEMDMSAVTGEVNRMLMELYKMEDIEYMRNSR